jgi:outer membrane lipoprotein-sorting protein
MLFRPEASQKAGTPMIRGAFSAPRRVLILSALVFSSLGACALPAVADQAQDVMKKMNEVYRTVKTFEGNIVIKQSGKAPNGKQVSAITTQQVRYKSPNMFVVNLKANVTGGPAGSPSSIEETIVSDGKMLYQYNPAKKMYNKKPAPPAIALSDLLRLTGVGIPGPNLPGLAMASPTSFQGHSALVVQFKPQAPPGAAANPRANIPVNFYIDKQSHQLLGLRQVGANLSVTMDISGQKLNGGVALSLFAFHPPAGAKEAAAPMPGSGRPGVPPHP